MDHYTEIHEKRGCELCERKKTGNTSIEDTLLKVALLQSHHDGLVGLFEQLERYVSDLSLTDWNYALGVLYDGGHVGVAGLVYHFMVNAMNMSTGGD